jgi:MFS family permease
VSLHAPPAEGVFEPQLQAAPSASAREPSRRSARGLDWFVFFVADVQTGFGPFVSVYLTTQKWTQVDIGIVLSIGSIVGLIGQMPGGLIVDAARRERLVAGIALSAITASALAYALLPIFPVIFAAATLHAAASCVLGPCIAALSLGLVGYAGIGARLGRNARFASLGNGIAAAAMGALGYYFSAHAVFFVTAALLIPTLFALSQVQPHEINVQLAHGGDAVPKAEPARPSFRKLLRQRPLFLLAGCIALFHLANAAMLPLMGSVLTTRSGAWATVLIAACIVVPQGVVALISPWVGRQAEIWGRRVFLVAAFSALALRGLLFATVTDPWVLVAVQLLDGITAASLGVMVPLIIADVSRGTGHFSFAQGIVGTAVGVGASISPTLAGYLSDQFGSHVAFFTLAGIAAIGLAAVATILPETRPTAMAAETA